MRALREIAITLGIVSVFFGFHALADVEYYANEVKGTDCDCIHKKLMLSDDVNGADSKESDAILRKIQQSCKPIDDKELKACSEI